MPATKPDPFLTHLLSSLFLFALAAYPLITHEARFSIGRDENKTAAQDLHDIQVAAKGMDAVVIGLFAAALGFLNLSQGIRGGLRITVFAIGALMLLGCFGYWALATFFPSS